MLKRDEGVQGPHALLMKPFLFQSTRAAINTTVSLIIDVTVPAANTDQCMFRGQKHLPRGVTLSMEGNLQGTGASCANSVDR